MTKHDIRVEFDSRPPDAQREVLDFIGFLRERYGSAYSVKKRKRPGISKERFVGIWRDRDDMRDSSRWVRQRREREWA
jgi:hypothetical protein